MESKAMITGAVDMYQPVKMVVEHWWRETSANTKNNTIDEFFDGIELK